MLCSFFNTCGGCRFRHKDVKDYQKDKESEFCSTLLGLKEKEFRYGKPVFINDGTRRRATMAFFHSKGSLTLGFNENRSNSLINIDECSLLTNKINKNIENIRELLSEVCKVKISAKKGKKVHYTNVYKGDISITEVENGLDVVLEFSENLELEHRMIIFEFAQKFGDIIRISHRKDAFSDAETIIEKTKPFVKIAGYDVFISAGTFLQPSKEGEKALINLVETYIDGDTGKIADLFCGIGTFSYPLSKHHKNKILAVDSSKSLLDGFKHSINKNMISNIEIEAKNLFKYPLDENELKGFDIIVFDPPRAGAEAQAKKIAMLKDEDKPHKIIAISCNPNSFIKDANILTSAGYQLEVVTLVDQFIYSNHSELVAKFTYK